MPLPHDQLLELVPACLRIGALGAPYTVSFITPYVEELLGYTPEQVRAEASFWIDRIHPEDRATVLEALARLAPGEVAVLEYRFQCADAQYGRFRDRVRRVVGGRTGGEVLFGLLEDLAEQRQLECQLTESEARFRRLAEQVPEVIVCWNVLPEQRCIYVSPAVHALTGYAPADFYADPLLPKKLLGEEEWEKLQRALDRTEPLPSPLQLRLVCKRGEIRWIETRLACTKDAAGRICAVEGIVHDITEHVLLQRSLEAANLELQKRDCELTAMLAHEIEERRQIEADLRQSRAQYQALVEALPDALLVLDATAHIRHFRPGKDCPLAEWGLQIVGKHLSDVLPTSQVEAALKQVADVLSGRKGAVFEFSLTIGGQEHSFEARLAVLGTAEVLAIVRDTTAERQRALQLQQVRSELAHVLRLSTLGEMAAGLAHELNQPLTCISGFARACIHRLSKSPPELEKAVVLAEQVCSQAAHAGEVIRRLRRFVARREPHFSSACLNEMVSEALRLMESEFRTAEIVPHIELQQGLLMVIADRIQIIQVILNLLRNAVDSLMAVPAEKRLLLVQTKPAAANGVELVVADSGPGLAADVQARLFQPFHTTKPDGLGLGLAISRSIIAAHKGRIWASPRAGGGAEFHFTLPLVPQ